MVAGESAAAVAACGPLAIECGYSACPGATRVPASRPAPIASWRCRRRHGVSGAMPWVGRDSVVTARVFWINGSVPLRYRSSELDR